MIQIFFFSNNTNDWLYIRQIYSASINDYKNLVIVYLQSKYVNLVKFYYKSNKQKDSFFNKWCWENWIPIYKKKEKKRKETGLFTHTIHKNKLRKDQIPKCGTETIKLLEENTGSNL